MQRFDNYKKHEGSPGQARADTELHAIYVREVVLTLGDAPVVECGLAAAGGPHAAGVICGHADC